MKKALALFLFTLCVFSTLFAQDKKKRPVTLTKTETSGFTFSEVIDLPSVTKEQAYTRVKKWVTTTLSTGDNNTSFDDKEKSTIATSAIMLLDKRAWMQSTPQLYFKISFSFKDGKMKIDASQFVLTQDGTQTPFDDLKRTRLGGQEKEIQYAYFDDKFSAMITSVTEAAKKDDNW